MKKVILVRASILLTIAAASVTPAWSQANVLTHHNDIRRTGSNLQEKKLTIASVRQKFGKLWTLFADGQIVAQPLYVSGLTVDGKGTFNAVIVSTMHNTIYAYDADRKPTLPQSQDALIWAQWLGDPQPETFGFDSWNTNFPEWGIVSTPVIDAARKTMYVVSWHRNNGGEFRLHAIDLTKAPFPGPGDPPVDYREIVKPVPIITGSVPKPGGGEITLDVSQQKQRAALLLNGGELYIAFATNRETDNSLHGWLFAYDAATLQQKAVWNVTPTSHNGGIWQAGSGPAADAAGNVYVMTGNGPFDADHAGQSYGDSFIKLKLEGATLAVKDYFTPCNQVLLDKTCNAAARCDLDLGSAGPLLVPGIAPGSDLLIGGGKDGNIHVVDTANMGHFKSPAGQVAMDCPNPNAVQTVLGGQQGGPGVIGNIHGSHVFWQGPDAARVFVWGENDNLRSYIFKNGKLTTPPAKSLYRVPNGMPGGMLSLSADGSKAGTGILWALVPLNGDANQQRGVRAQLLAFDAQNVQTDIWRSEPLDASFGANSVGLFAKFVAPTVANGKVFVATYGDHENPPGPIRYFEGNAPPPGSVPKNFYVAVYGLRP
ncbi:MAG TPA: hypothetical protein VGY48_18390 [Vicinamibacterales bacterium]|jgi:hypothetical protein|nr:hypothetical protein [Vicinamibacterales bacterium]